MGYTTPADDPKSQDLERRWEKASDAAMQFAIENLGKYRPILPQVIAEIFDAGRDFQRKLK